MKTTPSARLVDLVFVFIAWLITLAPPSTIADWRFVLMAWQAGWLVMLTTAQIRQGQQC